MKYRIRILVKEVYETWVEADDDETAQALAVAKLNDGEPDVELLTDTGDVWIEETDE